MLQKVKNCNTFYYFNYQNQKTQLEKVIMKYTESQLEKAYSLIEVTLLGIDTEVRPAHL